MRLRVLWLGPPPNPAEVSPDEEMRRAVRHAIHRRLAEERRARRRLSAQDT